MDVTLRGFAHKAMTLLCAVSLSVPLAARAQDAERGALLFKATGPTTGRQVGNCVACHANQDALREMLRNRGVKADDPRTVRVLLQRAIDGAQPGAASAKAQYRGVLSERDVQDLAAYLARASRS